MLNTPDVTPAQIAAYATAIVSALLVWFVPSATDAQKAAVAGAIIGATQLGFFIADAVVRHGRAQIAAKLVERDPASRKRPAAPRD